MNGFVHDIGIGVAMGIPMLVVVGPIALLLVDVGSQRGLRSGTPAAVGVALGDVLLAVIVAIGGTALASVLTPVAGWFRIIAAVMVAGLALHVVYTVRRSRLAETATQPALVPAPEPVGAPVTTAAAGRLMGGFTALTIANPLTLLVYVGLVVGGGAGVGTAGWVVGMGVASLAVHGSWVGVGHVMGTAVPPAALRILRYIAAGLLLGLAVHLLLG